MQRPRPGQLFETSDLNVAAFLRCRGFSIEDLRCDNPRVVFTFADSQRLREAILDYANDGPVPVRSFCNTLRDLKGLTRFGDGPRERPGSREMR